MKTCNKCSVEKSIFDFHIKSGTRDGHTSICKICVQSWQEQNKERLSEYSKEYRALNSQHIAKYKKSFYLENKENLIKKDIERNLFKRKDPLEKMKHNIRANISKGFRNLGEYKNSPTEAILGCTFLELHKYLISSFVARYGREPACFDVLHIDHIKPISLAISKIDLVELNHYTNLQLLLAEDNLRKGDKYE